MPNNLELSRIDGALLLFRSMIGNRDEWRVLTSQGHEETFWGNEMFSIS